MHNQLRGRSRRVARLCAVVVMAVAVAVARAQEPSEAALAQLFRVELRRQFASEEQLNTLLRKTYGVDLAPDKAEVARGALRTLLADPAVPAYLAQVLRPTFRPERLNDDATSVVLDGVVQLQVRGLRRLPASRQEQFLQHVVQTAQALPPEKCKAGYLGQIPLREAVALEMRVAASLPLQRFEAIIELYRDAMRAELAGSPPARTVTDEQAALARRALQEASARRVRAALAPAAVARFTDDGAASPADEFCALACAALQGVLDLPEPHKSWQLTRFVEGLQ